MRRGLKSERRRIAAPWRHQSAKSAAYQSPVFVLQDSQSVKAPAPRWFILPRGRSSNPRFIASRIVLSTTGCRLNAAAGGTCSNESDPGIPHRWQMPCGGRLLTDHVSWISGDRKQYSESQGNRTVVQRKECPLAPRCREERRHAQSMMAVSPRRSDSHCITPNNRSDRSRLTPDVRHAYPAKPS